MLWEELARSSVDYHVLLELRGPDGRSLDAQEASLSGGGAGTSEWLPGHWLVQSSFVLAERAAPGRYTVTAALYDSRARTTVPIEGRAGVRELVVGDLTVRQ